jgi:hypothetical protein
MCVTQAADFNNLLRNLQSRALTNEVITWLKIFVARSY